MSEQAVFIFIMISACLIFSLIILIHKDEQVRDEDRERDKLLKP